MPRLQPLSGLDAAFLYLEAAGTPMHVGGVLLLRAPRRRGYDFERALRARIGERLPELPALRRVLVDAPFALGHPRWQEAESVDLDAHLTRRRLAAPGSRLQLWREIARLHAPPLPRNRPLWQLALIDGIADGEIALYCKVHHALLDGQGGVALVTALLDRDARGARSEPTAGATARRAPRAARAHERTLAEILADLPAWLGRAAGAALGTAQLLNRVRANLVLAPRTPFNAQVSRKRSFAVAELPLAHVRRIAKQHDASVNDVVLALCAGALRDWLRRRKALPEAGLVAAMPVSLRNAGDATVNNQVSMVQCRLPTDVAGAVDRLRAISASTARIKQQVGAFRGVIPTDFPGFAAPVWASLLARLWAGTHVAERAPPLANLVISNLPGPPQPLYLAGARVAHSFPVSIVTHGLGLNITVTSYAGMLEFGLLACSDNVPRLDAIAAGIERGLSALEQGEE